MKTMKMINKSYAVRLVKTAKSGESGLRGGQTTTTRWHIVEVFQGKAGSPLLVASNGEAGPDEEFAGAANFVVATGLGGTEKIPCGCDSGGFFVVDSTRAAGGKTLDLDDIQQLLDLVEVEFRKTEAEIVSFHDESANAVIDGIRCLARKTGHLQALYDVLSSTKSNSAYAPSIYLG
jgi:hypothetical protein